MLCNGEKRPAGRFSAPALRSPAGERLALMGGIDNLRLLKDTPESIARDADEAHAAGIDIIGPECAIPLATPLENLKAIREL